MTNSTEDLPEPEGFDNIVAEVERIRNLLQEPEKLDLETIANLYVRGTRLGRKAKEILRESYAKANAAAAIMRGRDDAT